MSTQVASPERKPAGPSQAPQETVPGLDLSEQMIARAVDEGMAAGRAGTALPRDQQKVASVAILQARSNPDKLGAAVSQALDLVRKYPSSAQAQVLAARAIDLCGKQVIAAANWDGVSLRHPENAEAFQMSVRWVRRRHGEAAALRRISQRFPLPPTHGPDVFLYARAMGEARQFGAEWAAYEALIKADDAPEETYIAFAKSLMAQGQINRAQDVLIRAGEALADQPHERITRMLANISVDLFEISNLVGSDQIGNLHNAVLDHALQRALSHRRQHRQARSIGSVVLINGALGAGGAERQFVNTACGLQEAMDTGQRIAGIDVLGPVTACVRHMKADGASFFLPTLEAAGVPVLQYFDFEPFGGSREASVAGDYADLLRFLPAQIAEGVRRLSDVLRQISPDIVHIWQDGSILATSLAAVIADVPKIVLGVRSVPPVDRVERSKPQYEVIYRAMLRAPGVVLCANSEFAARRYAAWLEAPDHAVPVITNGIDTPDTAGDAASEALWREFEQRAPGSFTVGGVMRIDENKRPYLWLDAAKICLASDPTMRFIIVGDGPLLLSVKNHAERIGIADRVLFVGRSSRVGFWLSKLNLFMLLSRFEGMPNVLIEAQAVGVPVITTPAGGAAETVREGITGTVLSSAAEPLPEDIAGRIIHLKSDPDRLQAMGASARVWADERFSRRAMLETTIGHYLS